MSNFKISSYIYKMLGFTEQEFKLILQRNREYDNKRIMTSDSLLLKSKRYEGLTSMDAMLAEHFNNEFGHLTDPILAMQRKHKK